MINIEDNTLKCNHCETVITINKEKLKQWATRQHIQRVAKENKHYCPKCSKLLGFYINGVVIY